jgi:malonyl-CoA O-methyltransferase
LAAPTTAVRPVDPLALSRVVQRLHEADSPPWLHTEVARRMADRLPIVRLQPQCVLAWAPRVGGGLAELRRTYPQARLLRVEPLASARVAAGAARSWWPFRRAADPVMAPEELQGAAGQLLWANMGLHGEADPRARFEAWHRVIAVDGFLMFSTLGPGTLQSLARLYREAGWPAPAAPLVDMHDLGDMLVTAGFADPVMDQETVTLTWPDAEAALAELRTLGGNISPQRFAGLRTPRWRQRLGRTLVERAGTGDGRIALEFEIVYGHAFRPAPRPRLAAQTEVSVDEMRQMVRSTGRRP